MQALVTGPTGFIGSHLVEELLKQGYKVRCLVRESSDKKWLEDLDVEYVIGDCLDPESLVEAVSGVDFIFHLAAITKTARVKEYYEVNVGGTENVLACAAENAPGLKRFVYLSSLAAVGPSPTEHPADESTEPHPVSDHGKSKLMGEQTVIKYSSSLPVTVIRPPAVYGPRDTDFFVLYRMLKRRLYLHWGKCYYSLLYMEDLVRGLVEAAESSEAEGGIFFLSEDDVYSNEEIAGAISSALGTKPVRVPLPHKIMPVIARIGQIFAGNTGIINIDKVRELRYSDWVCSPAKAVSRLGFTTRTSMNEGFKWTANWYRIHRWL